jgi:hypothetical protein
MLKYVSRILTLKIEGAYSRHFVCTLHVGNSLGCIEPTSLMRSTSPHSTRV